MSTNSGNSYPFSKIVWIGQTDNDYIGRCPFCGDSIKSKNHGHLYVSKRYPIYHCYRCEAKGFLKDIERILNESCKIEYKLSVQYDIPRLDIHKILYETREIVKLYSMFITDQEKEYFRSRARLKKMHDSTILKFSLFPDCYARQMLYETIFKNIKKDYYRTWTIRGLGTGISGRSHSKEEGILRYINGITSLPWSQYVMADTYFINSEPITKYTSGIVPDTLVIAEGIYDIVPIYLNRSKYGIQDSLSSIFMAAQCSAYDRCVTVYKLLYNTLPKNILIFADIGISMDKLKKQFLPYSRSTKQNKVTINWPRYKDWDDAGAIKHSVEL